MMSLLLSLLIILMLILMLATAAEGALLALPREDRESLKGEVGRAASTLRKLLESPKQLFLTLQVVGDLALTGVALTLALLVIDVYGPSNAWWTLLGAPPAVLILGLILPRAVAVRHPRAVCGLLALPVQGVILLLLPLTWPLKRVSEQVMDLAGIAAPGSYRLEESEFRTLVDIGEKEGALREQERELIHNVFEFGDIVASEVMTPRTELVGFSINTPVERILEGIKAQRFARVPIYKTNLDNILGILYTKDLLALRVTTGASPRSLKDLLHAPYYVPMTKKVDELFREFQRQKTHLAVVVDEYGGVAGIVTMDDLLEELFGEMLDEHDVEEPSLTQVSEHEYLAQGSLDLEQFCEQTGMDVPEEEEEINTLGGFIMDRFGALPQSGESVRHGEYEFVVEKVQGTRLQEIRVIHHPEEEPGEDPEGEKEES